MEDLKKKPTAEIIQEMSVTDQQIWSLILKYNKLVAEITTRFPQTKKHEDFQPKVLKIGGNYGRYTNNIQ